MTDNTIDLIVQTAVSAFLQASPDTLESLRVQFLGDKSELQAAQKNIVNIPPDQRKAYGQIVNQARRSIEQAFTEARDRIDAQILQQKLQAERIDITLDGIQHSPRGSHHPMSLITSEVSDIFRLMGFQEAPSPEIDTEYYNFTALNTPEGHPARDEQDTFYTNIAPNVVMRSHVSNFQVHAMETQSLPIRSFSTGRVYRNEEVNFRKLPFFHQFEILYIDSDVSFANLRWVLQNFFDRFFGQSVEFRLRPDFFPFTEPSAEVDARCLFCGGAGCQTCGGKGWLELLGCGMVDPNVLSMSGIDPDMYSGFAAGFGLERFAMLKYGFSDIRDFYTGDMRILRQF